MTEFDAFQMRRAAEAARFLRSAEYKKAEREDKIFRAAADRKVGHTPLCGILKCHHSCKQAA